MFFLHSFGVFFFYLTVFLSHVHVAHNRDITTRLDWDLTMGRLLGGRVDGWCCDWTMWMDWTRGEPHATGSHYDHIWATMFNGFVQIQFILIHRPPYSRAAAHWCAMSRNDQDEHGGFFSKEYLGWYKWPMRRRSTDGCWFAGQRGLIGGWILKYIQYIFALNDMIYYKPKINNHIYTTYCFKYILNIWYNKKAFTISQFI